VLKISKTSKSLDVKYDLKKYEKISPTVIGPNTFGNFIDVNNFEVKKQLDKIISISASASIIEFRIISLSIFIST